MEGQFENLKCDCGSESFIITVAVRWRPAGGIVNQAGGYRCANCKRIAAVQRMITDVQQRHLQAKINELQEQANANAPGDKIPLQKGNEAEAGLRAGEQPGRRS